ncbi:MAG: hypothetical protein UT63_C0008G0010 [Candidatus Gottesmanbacteria bacterium GW2011_GWC2_39_8]|uniref:Transposase IS200-like domain-containing protein n=1 Tax=Candidatus Gottesmanbacteria bacterium GW2011_GWC2_39_8 TaxID=1618450 RepID=A0A0G0Q9K1_9BACT|nr:MAG: hypothetical protein UT63_C0008G0010 [Candidatus Gottesmanbacteria bacterium GW2011_GWC2_39_8]
MASNRNLVLSTGEIYHVFNRGVERRTIFSNKYDFDRALETINFYRFSDLPIRYSHYMRLDNRRKEEVFKAINVTEVSILAFCLMPNHFHFVLRQEKDKGISTFISNFSNSYSKYFNTKNDRVGPLLQGIFKAVRVETDEQLIHLSRYVHLNPVASYLIKDNLLEKYEWSSLPEYLGLVERSISEPQLVMGQFKNKQEYMVFVRDQINYAKQLESIKHLIME